MKGKRNEEGRTKGNGEQKATKRREVGVYGREKKICGHRKSRQNAPQLSKRSGTSKTQKSLNVRQWTFWSQSIWQCQKRQVPGTGSLISTRVLYQCMTLM